MCLPLPHLLNPLITYCTNNTSLGAVLITHHGITIYSCMALVVNAWLYQRTYTRAGVLLLFVDMGQKHH